MTPADISKLQRNLDAAIVAKSDENGRFYDPGLAAMLTFLRQLAFGSRKALFMSAAHCQGGHSGAGRLISELLGVPFPLRMTDLVDRAKAEGLDPLDLWPWSSVAYKKTALPKAAESWLEWAGGGCPLDIRTAVKVRLRSGTVLEGCAGSVNWAHGVIPAAGEVVAYQLVAEAE